MDVSAQQPGIRRRLAAIGAIVLLALVVAATIGNFLGDLQRLAIVVPLVAIAIFAAWYAITRVGVRRAVGVVVALAAFVGIVAIAIVEGGTGRYTVVPRLILLALALWLARRALGLDDRTLKRHQTPGAQVPAATSGVLIVNPKSGGGKAERSHLVDACRARGIEPLVLRPGDDVDELAREAIAGGADVIGMAGGDGSQALVAAVAAEHRVPLVVVPAGTRNHLAADLGLDRDDVVGALEAFGEASECTIDLGDVNGHVFVNNVSLGLYAAIVRTPEYREAKMETTLSAVPKMLAPGTPSFDLSYTGPEGERHDGAHVIQVSNNPYGDTVAGLGSRPRLDTGRLGVVALEIHGDKAIGEFIEALTTNRPQLLHGLRSWETPTFEVTSSSPIVVGLDGESLEMDPPLSFSIRDRRLRVRLPPRAIGYSPAARAIRARDAMRGVWRVALGRPAH